MLARLLAACALLAAVAGCGSVRPTGPPDALRCNLRSFVVDDIYSQLRAFRAQQPRPRALTDPQPGFTVLALSAGGEFGAYGAGFLNGWRSIGPSALPVARDDIQVVTGVSTGAILATHAFLGMDREIEHAYREISGPQIYRSRGLLGLITANSLLDAAGKDRLIEEYLKSDVIDRVAAMADSGRFLYLGVVDLDSGEFLRIDMLRLAAGLPAEVRDACYRAVVGASSAIPIAFPPKFVYANERVGAQDLMMLVDGGARRHTFIVDLPAEARRQEVRRRLLSFVHGDLEVDCQQTANGVLPIAGRTAGIMTDQGLKDSLLLQHTLAEQPADPRDPARHDKLFDSFYASAAEAARACQPERAPCEAGEGALNQEDMFCRPFMNCLADRGREDGARYAHSGRWQPFDELNRSSRPACAGQVRAAPRALRRLMQ